ncbi:autotransporter assembly complex protein TamA [Acinetobacter rudis]|uniref:autotransporter assembly complex protein TamA n=1 Tax=Acinetobacter rudis TaxID=632955 RepID=UPI00333F3F1A
MPTQIQFRKSVITYHLHKIIDANNVNKYLCLSVFLSVFVTPNLYAQPLAETAVSTDQHDSIELEATAYNDHKAVALPEPDVDSVALLQQQIQASKSQPIQPLQFEDLEDLPANSIDPNMANEIYQAAEDAKKQAQDFKQGVQVNNLPEVAQSTEQEFQEIKRAPVDIDQLMRNIEADKEIIVQSRENGNSFQDFTKKDETVQEKPGFIKRIVQRIRPPKEAGIEVMPKITTVVDGAPTLLAQNIRAKLSSFTVESFSDYASAVPQLRSMTNQAAQAVGYYNATFKFEKQNDHRLHIQVTPGEPAIVETQHIEFLGEGGRLPQFQVLALLPELNIGDTFNHGLYESTKANIQEAASNNGFFDSLWRLHDVKVNQPENTVDINLRYDTGQRYKLGHVEFRMSDPDKPLPIKLDILKTLAPWQPGADYTAWRVNGLANNLTNSRYFNFTLVDAVRPDALPDDLDLPPDLQALVDANKISEQAILNTLQPQAAPVAKVSNKEVTQTVVDEQQFAGAEKRAASPGQRSIDQQNDRANELDVMKDQVRIDKVVPVIVTLNADKLNSLETGIGYGTDTGVRVRSQYRRAIVNQYGHAFDANMEVSKIRQSLDGRYSIPYKHPLNDYISLVGGYERETRDGVGPNTDLTIETAVLGADRIIKNSRREWQQIFGVRYRLDRMTRNGDIPDTDIPNGFLIPGAEPEQEAFLVGYEVSKTISNNRINPTQGFKQSYKIELGSDKVLSNTNMAIVNANWKALYSLGENANHQFLAGANVGYIYADDFNKVPYNLRYFAGGDQSMRGFDYKSLSPMIDGYKVGGQGLAIGTMEYNYQFKEGWRAALFSDFGNAYDEKFSNPIEYSVGVGVRWRSPIGPIRLDVASGVSEPGKPVRLHFFIGSQL